MRKERLTFVATVAFCAVCYGVIEPSAQGTAQGLQGTTGSSALDRVRSLGGKINGDDSDEVDDVGKVVDVDLASCAVTDDDLELFGVFKHLRTLNLARTAITSRGAKNLLRLGELGRLNLSDTRVDDSGLDFVSQLVQLEYLDLTRCKVTDSGVHKLTRLLDLQSLGLSDTKISDISLSHIRSFKSLSSLVLYKTDVTDRGLLQLVSLRHLCSIAISDADISDAGLRTMLGLRSIKHIVVIDTRISEHFVAKAKSQYPGVNIIAIRTDDLGRPVLIGEH